MRCLTLTQPWASLIALGQKKIETRSWGTPYRGPLAIHAAAGLSAVGGKPGLIRLCGTSPFREALAPALPGWNPLRLPFGAVVAVCTLVDCLATDHVCLTVTHKEKAFGDYSPNRCAWLLEDVRPLAVPVPYRGALGLWTLPDHVLAGAGVKFTAVVG